MKTLLYKLIGKLMNKPEMGQRLPIDRPCSACSAGDYQMEHHLHYPPFGQSIPLAPLGIEDLEISAHDYWDRTFPIMAWSNAVVFAAHFAMYILEADRIRAGRPASGFNNYLIDDPRQASKQS